MQKQLLFWLFGFMSFILMTSNNLCAQNKEGANHQTKRQSDLYLRAPEVIPGTLPK